LSFILGELSVLGGEYSVRASREDCQNSPQIYNSAIVLKYFFNILETVTWPF